MSQIEGKPQDKCEQECKREKGLVGGKILHQDRAAYAATTPGSVTFLEDLLCMSQALARYQEC